MWAGGSTIISNDREILKNSSEAHEVTKKRVAFLTALLVLFPGVFVSLWLGFRLIPSMAMDPALRYGVHATALLLSYPAYLLWLFLRERRAGQGPAVILAGTFLRFAGLFALGLWSLPKSQAVLKSVLLIYLVSILSFLFFEVVSIMGMEFYARKRS